MNPAANEKAIFVRVASGDEDAFRELFNEYWDHIYSVAMALTKSVEMSEDMVQDIFIKVWNKRAELPAIERFDNFLFIIARNHIYTELKKLSRDQRFKANLEDYFDGKADDTNAEQQLLLKESKVLVTEAISKLTPHQQEVYRLSREEGLSHEEIAGRLNISKNTVRNHIVNSLKTIREYLTEQSEGVVLIIAMAEAMLWQK